MIDLKRFRTEKKISQKELASALGVGQSFISQVEQGKDPMPEDWIGKISEIYDIKNISDYVINESPILRGDEKEQNISIPMTVWNVIQKQADSLSSRDRQIDELITVLKEQQQEMKKIVVQGRDDVKCADVG